MKPALRTLVALIAVTGSFVLFTGRASSVELLLSEREVCQKYGMEQGLRDPLNPFAKSCYVGIADFTAKTNGKDCDAIDNACCIGKDGKPSCQPKLIGITTANPDATNTKNTRTKCPNGYYVKVGGGQIECATTTSSGVPFVFNPNVPIPGLFDEKGGYPIDESLLVKYLSAFYVYFIGVIGILAVVMIMYGGYHYIVSLGNPTRMNQGKEIISSAIIGLVLALTSFLLLSTINPALIDFKGIMPVPISQILQPLEEVSNQAQCAGAQASVVKESDFEQIYQRVKDYLPTIKEVAADQGISPYLITSTMMLESGGRKDAMGPKTSYGQAVGLMQILLTTAQGVMGKDLTLEQLKEPDRNINAGARYLRYLSANTCLKVSKDNPCKNGELICKIGDPTYIHAAYNGGPVANNCSTKCADKDQTYWQCEKLECYAQTRAYVDAAIRLEAWLADKHPIT